MSETTLREVTVDDVGARLGRPGFFVYDNNNRARWQRGHVPGARNVVPPESMTAEDLPDDKNAELVFYCSGPT